MTDLVRKQFDYLAALTAIVVLAFVGASVYALVASALPFASFSGAVGPIAGMLVGYWVRGTQ